MSEPIVVFQYRCRRCGQVVDSPEQDAARSQEAIVEIAINGKTTLEMVRYTRGPANTENANDALVGTHCNVHQCDDGGIGLTDLIGISKPFSWFGSDREQ